MVEAQNPAAATGFDYYVVAEDNVGLNMMASTGGYDPKIGTEVNRLIRNLPQVRKYCVDMANLLRGSAGVGFVVIEGGGESRFRAYVAPDTSDAVKAELKDGALLKAALGMAGK